MPAYHTHAIFGEKFYNNYSRSQDLFKTEVDLESLKTFSLGIDLAALSPIDAHNQKTRAFLTQMIRLVKEKHLQEDKHVLAMLYGHIMHYFLDLNTHPFIYYHEQGIKQTGFVKPHFLYEGYLSYHFFKQLKNVDITTLNPSYFNRGKIDNKNCKSIIDETYYSIYGQTKISKVYKKTLGTITTFEKTLRCQKIKKELIKKVSGFDKMVETYDLKPTDFTNSNYKTWHHPITNKKSNMSATQLFQQGMADACLGISRVNKYLYGDASLTDVEKVFTNLSYDTALPCEVEKNFVYVKKYKRNK